MINAGGGGARFRVHHESNLRRVTASPAHRAEHLAQICVDLRIRARVGGVKDQHVHPRVGQQLRVSAQHPRVVAAIIAIQRFTPIMRHAVSAPKCAGGIGRRAGLALENLGHVIGTVQLRTARPVQVVNKIEDAHETICPGQAHFARHRQPAAQSIGGGPRHARVFLGQDLACGKRGHQRQPRQKGNGF